MHGNSGLTPAWTAGNRKAVDVAARVAYLS